MEWGDDSVLVSVSVGDYRRRSKAKHIFSLESGFADSKLIIRSESEESRELVAAVAPPPYLGSSGGGAYDVACSVDL